MLGPFRLLGESGDTVSSETSTYFGQSAVDSDITRSVVPLIRGDIPRFHTLPVSMPKLAENPHHHSASVFDSDQTVLNSKGGAVSNLRDQFTSLKNLSKFGSSIFK